MAKRKAIELIDFLEKCLKERGLKIVKIILFGSQAKEMTTKESDLDGAVAKALLKIGRSKFGRYEK